MITWFLVTRVTEAKNYNTAKTQLNVTDTYNTPRYRIYQDYQLFFYLDLPSTQTHEKCNPGKYFHLKYSKKKVSNSSRSKNIKLASTISTEENYY